MNHWVYDLETLSNCIVGVFEHYKTNEKKIFIIHKLRDDTTAFRDFLHEASKNGEWLISFNGLSFDSQILGELLQNNNLLKVDAEPRAMHLSAYAQKVISRQDTRQFNDYPEWKLPFQQVDIFKMNHWDGKNAGLKWIQYSMDWHNVQEMPIHHSARIETWEQINKIVEYCENDVASTKEAMHLSKEQIALRRTLTKEYNINLYSASEPKISKELFAHFLCEKLGMEKRELKKLRTKRDLVVVKDILLPYLNFKTPKMQEVKNWFSNLVIDYTEDLTEEERKKKYKFSVTYKGVKTDYGLGGIHGARPGIFTSKNGYIIMTSDVTSFYPNLGIENNWSPNQFPPEIFCELYKWFFVERKKIPKKDPKNYVYKIILNSTYGLSKDENCFLYDPEFTMRITTNGQLSLSLLYEMLAEEIPGAIPLMQNTDGLEMMIPEIYKDKYLEICSRWEKLTRLQLEHGQYEKMYIWDVNNYIAVSTPIKVEADPKTGETAEQIWLDMKKKNLSYVFFEKDGNFYYNATKCKGRFEWEDQQKKKVAILHKNKSFLIIPKAIHHYFLHGVKPEFYLQKNRNIFDYCAGIKATKGWYFTANTSDGAKLYTDRLQDLNRYYVSKKGVKLMKCHDDGRMQQVDAGTWRQTIFNVFEDKPWEDYQINEDYYLQYIYQEIANIREMDLEVLKQDNRYVQTALF